MNSAVLRNILYPLALALCGLFLQGSLLRFVLPDLLAPNLVLILVVFLGFFEVSPLGAILVFLIGLISDLCSGVALGPLAGSYSIVFGILATLSTRLFVESKAAVAMAVFLSSLLNGLVFFTLSYHFSLTGGLPIWSLLVEALITALLAPLTFMVLKRILLPRRERPATRLGSRQRLAAT